eukprot:1622850-Pyramimonas_sp.AAC.1
MFDRHWGALDGRRLERLYPDVPPWGHRLSICPGTGVPGGEEVDVLLLFFARQGREFLRLPGGAGRGCRARHDSST